jgi:hypothetical protein
VKTTGKVTHLEVKDSTILWAVDEPVSPETMPHVTVGTVYLLNSSDMSTIPVKVSVIQLVLLVAFITLITVYVYYCS